RTGWIPRQWREALRLGSGPSALAPIRARGAWTRERQGPCGAGASPAKGRVRVSGVPPGIGSWLQVTQRFRLGLSLIAPPGGSGWHHAPQIVTHASLQPELSHPASPPTHEAHLSKSYARSNPDSVGLAK